MSERVPLPSKTTPFTAEDFALRIEPPRVGQLVAKMFMDESLLRKIGARAVESAIDQMGRHAVYEHQDEVHSSVATLLLDSEWAKPIIEDEMRKAVRAMVLTLWSDEEKKNLRDWFDLFTSNLMGRDR